MSAILRTHGTGNCLLCGHRLAWNEQRYCTGCHANRASMVSRLEADDDLLRVLIVCSRQGAPVPHALFKGRDPQSVAMAVNARLGPLLDFFTASAMQGKLLPAVMGVLWVDLSADLTSLYHGTPKHTDAWKTDRYNDRMRPKLYQLFTVPLLVMAVSEFRRTRDLGFDFLFPKGQDSL